MSRLPVVPLSVQACPFCGVAAPVAHETQEGCIAALNVEIGRMRSILATLRPAGVSSRTEPADDPPAGAIRIALK